MRVRTKDSGKVVMEINPVAEPRLAEEFYKSLQGLSRVRFKKILATTDFSELSLKGVEYAMAVSEEFGATLTLVNAVEPSVYLAGVESVVIGRSDDEIVKAEKRHLSMLAKKLSGDGRPIRPVTRYGKAFREITDLAREMNADLVVTTTHGYQGLKRALIGSTAEWVVRYAPCPVVTVPAKMAERKSGRGRSGRIKRIVVPIDFSERSAKALPYAAALAERFDASVTLMHVTEIPAAVGMDYIPTATAQAQAEQMAEGLLLRAQRESFPEGVSTRTVVKSGSAYHEITRTAQKEDADLIVLTTHGRTGLTHALLGSTAERVVRHSSCPVMVVREKASA